MLLSYPRVKISFLRYFCRILSIRYADEDLCSYYILYEACQLSILHDDSIQFNSLEFEDCSDSRVHKVPPICMLGIVYNNFQQPDPRCLAPLKLDTVSRI